jgi:hypothetical protein
VGEGSQTEVKGPVATAVKSSILDRVGMGLNPKKYRIRISSIRSSKPDVVCILIPVTINDLEVFVSPATPRIAQHSENL